MMDKVQKHNSFNTSYILYVQVLLLLLVLLFFLYFFLILVLVVAAAVGGVTMHISNTFSTISCKTYK